MSGFLPDNELRNAAANDVWKRREVDKLLELYLGGSHLGRIAIKLERNPKAIVRKIQEYIYNERDRVVNYQPRRRTSRKGHRMTPNEKQIIEECRKKGVDWKHIARVLCRSEEEIHPTEDRDKSNIAALKEFSQTLDLLLAYRYAYHIRKKKIVSDKTYDDLLEEEREYGNGEVMLDEQHSASNCPAYIVHLVDYLLGKKEAAGT